MDLMDFGTVQEGKMRPVKMRVPLKRSINPISTLEVLVAISPAITEISEGVMLKIPMAACW